MIKAEQITDFISKNLASGTDIIDSTAFMELVLWFEEAFDVAVDVEDMTPENFGTVRNMTEYIERQQA